LLFNIKICKTLNSKPIIIKHEVALPALKSNQVPKNAKQHHGSINIAYQPPSGVVRL